MLYEFDTTNTITATWGSAFLSKGAGDIYFSMNLNISGASDSTVDGGTTLAGLLQAANHIDYLRTVAHNFLTGADVDIITPAGSGTTDIDNRYITLTNTDGTQQLLQGLVFTAPAAENLSTSVSGTATVNLVSNTPNPDGITIGEVRTATNEALDTNERLHEPPNTCLLYTSPSPRDRQKSRMPSSA